MKKLALLEIHGMGKNKIDHVAYPLNKVKTTSTVLSNINLTCRNHLF